MASKHAWKVDLIPWDHKSPEQVTRLYEQRVACGWAADHIPAFVDAASKGGKCFYWVVCCHSLVLVVFFTILPWSLPIEKSLNAKMKQILGNEVPERETLLAKHVAQYPKVRRSLVPM